jgi:glycyl-tRNA synthetase
MAVHEPFKEGPRMVEKLVTIAKKQLIGKTFRREAQEIIQFLELLSQEAAAQVRDELARTGKYTVTTSGKQYVLTPDMVSFETRSEKETGESFIPHVIEPSFGIGRILYCVLEHAYWARPEDKDRGVLSLPPIISPIKSSVFPLQGDDCFSPFVASISAALTRANISHKVDETGAAIGKRYARTDELGIPFAITVDYETCENNTVTLRERDSMAQVRIPVASLVEVLSQLIEHKIEWPAVQSKYPRHVASEKDS